MKNIFLIFNISLFFAVANIGAQTIQGVVTNEQNELLIGAQIVWKGTNVGTVTDTAGLFKILKKNIKATLTVSYVGYKAVEVEVEPNEDHLWIEVQGVVLNAVEVRAFRPDTYVSTLSARNVETISSNELKKAPCCNLSEAFESNGATDVTYSDAVTGVSEIQLLGLRGIYSQLQIENRPALYGLGYGYALEYIPGTWLESIQIAKGAGTVVNGYQGITGQLNTELQKPQNDKPLFINAFGSTMGRQELNVHVNVKHDNGWNTGLYLHESSFQNQIDHDRDGFLNMPLKKQINGLFRANKRTANWAGQFNLQALNDTRDGGQVIPKGTQNTKDYWRMHLNAGRIEGFGKIAYLGFRESTRSIGLIMSSLYHDQNGYFGKTAYNGTQRSLYANLIYNDIIKSLENKIIAGVSFQYDDYKEQYQNVRYDRTDRVPGVFAEYSRDMRTGAHKFNNMSIILGWRGDWHNNFGFLSTPRANFKYNINENTALRMSAGKGWHTPNVIAENLSLLASNRLVRVLEPLRIEEAWNYGGNVSKTYKWWGKSATLNLDLYRTNFVNQIIIDVDNDYRFINVFNLRGKSFSNSFIATLNTEIINNLSMRLGYKWNKVETQYAERIDIQTLTPIHRGLVSMDYMTANKTWKFHVTTQIVGPQRLPDNDQLPHSYHSEHGTRSPTYATVQAQITKVWKQWEVYIGGENLTNYVQHSPIISAQNPWDEYFNASQVWAPTMGARGYMGVRYSIAPPTAALENVENNFPNAKNVLINDARLVKETMQVAGLCGMCKGRIEKAALQNGALYADWDVDTKMLTLQFDVKKTNLDALEIAIAKVGHDTPHHKANDKIVASLPDCCQYR